VDLAGEKVSINFNPKTIDIHAIVSRVKQIGYGIATGKAQLPIKGLHKNDDAQLLEKQLLQQNGVLLASVDFSTEYANIEYIPGMTGIAELASLIRKAGFEIIHNREIDNPANIETKIHNSELLAQKRLLIVGLCFTIPLIIFSMMRDFRIIGFQFEQYAMLLAATVVQFVVGWQFYVGAYKSLRAGSTNMDVLIVMGSSVAYFSSLLVTIGIINSSNVYFETGAAIITLIKLGKYLETRAKGKTTEAMKPKIRKKLITMNYKIQKH